MLIQLLIIQILTFIALIVALRFLFYRHLNSALRRLKELQEEALIKEGQIKDELERAKQERLSQVEKGRQEARQLIEEAKKEVESLRLKVQEESKQESSKIVMLGKEDVGRLKDNLLSQIEDQALGLSLELLTHAFSRKGWEGLQRQLNDEVITEIEQLDKSVFSVKSGQVKVSSPVPFSAEEKARLSRALGAKLGQEVVLEEECSPQLIAGLVVKIGEFVIDGSLRNKLQKVVPYLKKNASG